LVFLKLGTIAFGGPAAHLAMMEEEFVRRRQWITQAEFLDRLATANLIPGPSSTEVAIFVGQLKRGWRGLIVAGCCFIIPAALIVSVIAWAYVRFGSLPKVEGVLYAIKPAVVAIVIQALWKLGRTGVRTPLLAVIAGFAAGLSFGSQSGAGAGVCRVGIGGGFGDEEPAAGRGGGFRKLRASESCCGAWRLRLWARLFRSGLAVVLVVSENWVGGVRQRICLAGISANRVCGASALADREAVD
jgi:chromate transport protein ChrA